MQNFIQEEVYTTDKPTYVHTWVYVVINANK